MFKSQNPSHHPCPDLAPVMTTIGVDPEIATITTRLRTFLHYVHVHARKVVCVNTMLSGVCYILCCMNMLSMLISSNYITHVLHQHEIQILHSSNINNNDN